MCVYGQADTPEHICTRLRQTSCIDGQQESVEDALPILPVTLPCIHRRPLYPHRVLSEKKNAA
jgi:hypothetical protein